MLSLMMCYHLNRSLDEMHDLWEKIMKQKKYIIKFVNGKTVFARAMTEEEATILAQAIMIKNGLTYQVLDIKQVYDSRKKEYTDFIA